MTPIRDVWATLVATGLRLLAEHDAEHAEARWPQATTDPRPSGETPDPTSRTAAAPDPTNQRRADTIATTIRNAYGLLQDCERDGERQASDRARREGLCINCRITPADGRSTRCSACRKYFQRHERERPPEMWTRRTA